MDHVWSNAVEVHETSEQRESVSEEEVPPEVVTEAREERPPEKASVEQGSPEPQAPSPKSLSVKEWRRKHPDQYREYQREYMRKRRAEKSSS